MKINSNLKYFIEMQFDNAIIYYRFKNILRNMRLKDEKTMFIIAAMIFGIVYFDKYRFLLKNMKLTLLMLNNSKSD